MLFVFFLRSFACCHQWFKHLVTRPQVRGSVAATSSVKISEPSTLTVKHRALQIGFWTIVIICFFPSLHTLLFPHSGTLLPVSYLYRCAFLLFLKAWHIFFLIQRLQAEWSLNCLPPSGYYSKYRDQTVTNSYKKLISNLVNLIKLNLDGHKSYNMERSKQSVCIKLRCIYSMHGSFNVAIMHTSWMHSYLCDVPRENPHKHEENMQTLDNQLHIKVYYKHNYPSCRGCVHVFIHSW